MLIVGIDPGLNGGLSILDTYRPLRSQIPTILSFRNLAPHDIAEFLSQKQPDEAWLEKAGLHPKNGKQSYYQSGRNLGILEGILTALHIKIEYISPMIWQNSLDCRTKGDKNVSKSKAALFFPKVKVTHGIADALLISLYGYSHYVALNGKSGCPPRSLPSPPKARRPNADRTLRLRPSVSVGKRRKTNSRLR